MSCTAGITSYQISSVMISTSLPINATHGREKLPSDHGVSGVTLIIMNAIFFSLLSSEETFCVVVFRSFRKLRFFEGSAELEVRKLQRG